MLTLSLKNVIYKYDKDSSPILKGINMEFKQGKIYTIIGTSGAGKTTLLSLISGLDVVTKGKIELNKENLTEIDRDKYRANRIGVVFQNYNLLTNATALENIILSMNISESKIKGKKAYAYDLLSELEIDQTSANRKILNLSGGQQQRIGIARAIAHDPDIIIADEPTGNLDNRTEGIILELLTSLAHDKGKCVIIVTHSKKVTEIADEILLMRNGKITRGENDEQKNNDNY